LVISTQLGGQVSRILADFNDVVESGTELVQLDEELLELGHGFCFEARQKRILIGDSHVAPAAWRPAVPVATPSA
jgi:hypothetical protein